MDASWVGNRYDKYCINVEESKHDQNVDKNELDSGERSRCATMADGERARENSFEKKRVYRKPTLTR
uniref:Uncharacterized protein n=1 Tax=Heterorhabditis bacteriophora TaxID=37862 RepID=A0A1I7XN40_HETBA